MTYRWYLWVIVVVSGFATIGSLYIGSFGDPVANVLSGNLFDSNLAIIPCNLCWYIRLAMYPIFVASMIALFTDTEKPYRTICVLASLGLILCTYKYGLEMGWWMTGEEFVCIGSQADCGIANPLYFGFVSLATLGILANSIIIYCSIHLFDTK